MREFIADLLIGGMRIERVHGELQQEPPEDCSHDACLAGHLELPSKYLQLIEVNRPYRLQLTDGHAGQVIVSRITCPNNEQVHAEFQPRELAMASS